MKNQDIVKMLTAVKELLNWQSTLVCQALSHLDQDKSGESPKTTSKRKVVKKS